MSAPVRVPEVSTAALVRWVRPAAVLCTTVALACLPVALAAGAHIVAVQVSRRGTVYSMAMRLTLAAPPQDIFAALQDYAALPRYNPDLRRVRIEPTGRPDQVRLFATVHACVLFFCRTLRQEQIVTASAAADGGVLRAVLMPGGSFRSGDAEWTVGPCVHRLARTCLQIHMTLEPAFWVPPVIGPWIIRHKMYQEALRSGIGLVRVAAALEAKHPVTTRTPVPVHRGLPPGP